MLVVRHAGRFIADLWLLTIRSGRWWVALLVLVLVIAAAVSTTSQVVVPVLTYTLF